MANSSRIDKQTDYMIRVLVLSVNMDG